MGREAAEASSPTINVKLVELSTTHELWRGQGTLRLTWSRRAVLCQVTGQGHGEYASPITTRWASTLKTYGRVVLLLDFWEMPTYDSKLRIDLTGWAADNRANVEQVHLAAKSKVVQMGAAIANIALSGLITIYSDRGSFESALPKFGLSAR
jgi:hypothetical protein